MKQIIFTLLLIQFSLQAQDVISYNGNQKELDKRWDWAIDQAIERGDSKYWIVYTFERLMPENNTIGHYYNGESTGKRLAEILYPERPIDYINALGGSKGKRSSKEVKKEIALLFKMSNQTLTEVDMSTIDIHFRIDNLPIYWLGLTTEWQSINKISDTYKSIPSEEARETLIAAAGMHKSEEKSFTFLKDVIENDRNSELQEEAVFWIGHIENQQVVPFLKEIAFAEYNNDIGEKAVFSLYNLGSEQATDVLIQIAKNAKGDSKEKAIFWLGQLAGKKALQSLEDIAFSEDETEIQKQAVFALSQLEDGQGIPKLIKIANTHPNPKIRKNAIFWLGESEDDRALEALINMVKK